MFLDFLLLHSTPPPPVAQMIKRLPAMRETRVRSLSWEDPLEKEMETHSNILAWKILWMEEPGRLQSKRSQRVRQIAGRNSNNLRYADDTTLMAESEKS